MKSLALARLKRTQAVELVAQGMSYDQVAKAVGYSHRGSAHRAVFRALAEREVAGVDELRDLELARLDALQDAVWDRATAGDLSAVRVATRIIDQRIRLLGLDHHDRDHGGRLSW